MGGLLRKTVVSGAMSGSRAEDTSCCSYCCRSEENGDLAWTAKAQHIKYIAKREIPTFRRGASALFIMCYADVLVVIMESTCTKLSRGPWGTGVVLRVMNVRQNGVTRDNEERSWAPRRLSCKPCHMSYNSPKPIALSHRITFTPCRAAMGAVVAPLFEVPQEGSVVFSLFSLIKLHLASHPLASSYSRVTISSKKC